MSREHPMLLDPRTDEPLDHIRWIVDDESLPRRLWAWRLHPRTERGKYTARLLRLDELVDEVGTLFKHGVLPRWARLEGRASSDSSAARRDWDDLVADVLAVGEIPSASWSILDQLKDVGALSSLHLPRPPYPRAP